MADAKSPDAVAGTQLFKNAKKPLKKFWFFSLPVNICNVGLLPRS